MANKGVFAIILIVFICIFVLPLSIAGIVLDVVRPGSCDYKDAMGLDVSQYLLGLGVANCALCLILIPHIIWMFATESKISVISLSVSIIINAHFGLAWFIVGTVILYRGNIDCIRQASVHVIFVLVLWCLSAIQLLATCTRIKIKYDF